MGTKTVDEAGVETGTEAKSDQETVDVTKTDVTKTDEATETEADASAGAPDDDEDGDDQPEAIADKTSAGVGQGAAAVVSAALGLVSLTGSWLGTVGQARDSLYGQLETASTASVSTQIKQVYADSWNVNAFVAGLFALTALIVAVVVLARPAFGNPDRVQAPWIKSVAWAGVSLGIIGLLLAVLKYTDVLMSMPST
ncbi:MULTISPECIES: hypothetical protein [unclassified Streptomyces]|uniref:hypothetical protein n=1 Tax=unclassified Streptomyces TaxID=2593676 RepID=UPI002E81311F|nr:hypothetical protein [Streptomyces sp. NBC_00589]WTI36084.1 hypothetical protein OIC96_14295 [Streptomyces sp. NBC_00775]WUB30242.1 hypothetical protein OHA51_35435 [Streptomyces sp. NBC_00589]